MRYNEGKIALRRTMSAPEVNLAICGCGGMPTRPSSLICRTSQAEVAEVAAGGL
jgi:hypothetical protein